MIIWSGAIVIAGGVVSFAVSRRLNGEARIVGGYFAGFVASGLIAVLVVSLEEFQDQTQHKAMLIAFKELVGIAPALGVAAAEFTRRRSARRRSAPSTLECDVKRSKTAPRPRRSRSAR